MWGTAAIGMAVGAGMYWLGLFESAVLVAIQVILHRFPVGADALTTQEIWWRWRTPRTCSGALTSC